MHRTEHIIAVIGREDGLYVALCPEYDIASQGASVEEAKTNLVEAVELFFESASEAEVARRSRGDLYVTSVEVAVG